MGSLIHEMGNIFPRWTNLIAIKVLVCLGALGTCVVAVAWYSFTPKYTRVGYMPQQPIPFDHSLHAGQLGMDCRYCHTHVENAAHSNIPCLAEQLAGSITPPSEAAQREELAGKIRHILEELDPLDREIIALRHGEQLGRQEAADVLGIPVETAAKRYVRAVTRLRQRMADESIG